MSLTKLLVDSGQSRSRASHRDDLVTVLLGVWFVVGLFLDAWAHNNLPGLETFLTPWHAVFYTGFMATAGWICWLVWRQVRAGRTGAAAVPIGYGLGVIGLPLFTVAGMLDYTWHTVFGIEQEIKILFSPTHLILVTSMILIVTSPLRGAWADRSGPARPGLRALLPAVLSLAFATTLVLLFLQYANALVWTPHWIVEALSESPAGGNPAIDILASSIMVTSLVLVSPLLLMARRWLVPPGTATIVHLAIAGLCVAITAFHDLSIVAVLLIAGVLVDVLLAVLRPRDTRRGAYLAFAALAPLLTWSVYLGVAAVGAGRMPNVVEFWTGIPVVTALLGLLLGVLMLRPGASADVDRITDPDHPGSADPADVAGPVGGAEDADGARKLVRDEVDTEQRPSR